MREKGPDLRGCGVGLPGLEPGTSSLSGKRSNRLSYRPGRDPISLTGLGRLQHRRRTAQAGSVPSQRSSARVSSRPPSIVAARL
jgi:hypothetical protein